MTDTKLATWFGTLKRGERFRVSVAGQADVEKIWPLFKAHIEKLGEIPTRDVLLRYLTLEDDIFLIAIAGKEVVGIVFGYESSAKLFYITGSYTKKGQRNKGINTCMKMLIIRMSPYEIIKTGIYSEQGDELAWQYKKIAEIAKINPDIKRRKDLEHDNFKYYDVTLGKTRETNKLLEELLKAQYGIVY